MIALKPFTAQDFNTLKSWIHSEEELVQFAGPLFSFPLTDEQLQDYLHTPSRQPLKIVLSGTQETIGHCELNFHHGNHRLSRILIGRKDLRGKRIGEQVVREMVARFFSIPDVEVVDLCVFSWNKGAIRCYEKVGFSVDPSHSSQLLVNGKTWTRLNMTLERGQFR